MPAKANRKQSTRPSGDQRRLRTQQIVFIVISLFIILAMLLSFVVTL